MLLSGFLFRYLPVPGVLTGILSAVYSLSLVLFLFNLIPIAPLDGSKLLGLVIPLSKEDWYQRFLSQGPVYIILLIIGDRLIAEVSGFSFLGIYLQFGYDLLTTVIMVAT